MIKWILASFHRKVGALLLASGMLFSLSYTSIDYYNNKNELREIMQRQSQQLADTLALLLAEDVRYNKYYPLWNNLDQVYKKNSQQQSNLGRLFYIQEIVIIDNDNKILGHTDPKNHPLLSSYHNHLEKYGYKNHTLTTHNNHIFVKNIPVTYSGEKIGELIVSYDAEPMLLRLEQLFTESIYLTIFIFLAIILVTSLLARFINTPLRSIIQQLKNIGSNKINFSKLSKQHDEFGQLARTIQNVDKQLFEDKIALEKYQLNLENLITERTQELEQTQKELVQSERLAVLGQLTATVSHELRNPLGAIRPSLYVLRKRIPEADDKLLSVMDRIDRNVQRCDHIVDELLDFTRIKQLEFSNIEFNSWLKHLINELELNTNITVTVKLSDKDIYIEIDTNRMRRAIINVVDNGCHAMLKEYEIDLYEPNSNLVLETKQDNDFAYLIVTDNGCGMAKDVAEKIFIPLFSTKGFGVGLGMPSVQKIIQQHNGEINISSTLDLGTTVTFKIPKQQADNAND